MILVSRYRLIFILALALLSAALLLNEHLVPAGDNATYMILGQSLATGKGYKMISDPRSLEMALYPPGYPLFLAGALALTGTVHNLLAAILPIKLVSIAFHLGATALTYDLLRQRSAALATITALLMAVNPHLLHFATEIGTEIPYLFLSLCCVWFVERYRREPSRRNLVWVAVPLVLTFYVRSIALVMCAAFVLYLVVQRRFQHAVLLLFIVGMLVAPWFIHSSLLPATGTSVGLGRGYFALYLSGDPYGTTKASLSDWIARLTQNLRIYAVDIWPDVLFPHALSASAFLGPSGRVFAGVISLLLLLGFILEARWGYVSEWYIAAFFASCVGYLWAQSRLIVPIIPFAIYYLFVAVNFLLQCSLSSLYSTFVAGDSSPQPDTANQNRDLPSSARWGRASMYALSLAGMMLMLSALAVDARLIQRNLRHALGRPVATYYAGDAEWSNYLQAMNWIAQDTSVRSVVMCRKADLLYILTGHPALEYPYSTDAADLMHAIGESHVAYVIEDAFTWTRTTAQYLQPALQAWQTMEPEALSLVHETDAPRTRVWRVNKLN